MSLSGVTSAVTNPGWFSFLSGRTTGAKVLAGGSLVASASTMVLGGQSESTSFLGGLLKFTDNIMSVLGIVSIFPPFAALTLPVAIYFGIRGITEIASGNFLTGGLQLLGALPVFGIFKGKNLLNYKGMVKGPLDEGAAKLLKIDNLKDPTKALEVMKRNVQRLEREVKAAEKVLEGATKKVAEAEKVVVKELEKVTKSLTEKGFTLPKDLATKSVRDQSLAVTTKLKEAMKAPTEQIAKLQAKIDRINKVAKQSQEKLQEALKAATTDAERKAIQAKLTTLAEKQKTMLEPLQKALVDPKKQLADLQALQKPLNGSLKTWGQLRAEAAYANKIVEANKGILKDAKDIIARTEQFQRDLANGTARYGDMLSNVYEQSILSAYNNQALQRISTDYLRAAQTAIGRSYGPVSEAQAEGIVNFVRTSQKKGLKEGTRELVKSIRTWWRDVLVGTTPDPIKTVAEAGFSMAA